MDIRDTIPSKIQDTKAPNLVQTPRNIKIITTPCNHTTTSGGDGITYTSISMGISGGDVQVDYQMYQIPDRMDIFYDGFLMGSTGGPVPGAGTIHFTYNPTLGGPYFIVIKITGGGGSTAWTYTCGCPTH